jgi:regulator of PEP synthase PpsR (kinase-PPPase family)
MAFYISGMAYAYVVSDGTGRTADLVLKTALAQFEGANLEIVIHPNIREAEQIIQVVREASDRQAFIVHTLVSDELRQTISQYGRQYNVETVDLIWPLLERLSRQLSSTPSEEPGLFRQINEAYFRRIETMEFAFHHDDGARIHELQRAEIVLLGVSRTFKTPLSIYLAFKGWFVANVPIILNMPMPESVYQIPPERVIALTTDPLRLSALRKTREEKLGGATGNYADVEHVREELIYARKLYQKQSKWPVIDVSSKPIEEIATEILNHIKPKD